MGRPRVRLFAPLYVGDLFTRLFSDQDVRRRSLSVAELLSLALKLRPVFHISFCIALYTELTNEFKGTHILHTTKDHQLYLPVLVY